PEFSVQNKRHPARDAVIRQSAHVCSFLRPSAVAQRVFRRRRYRADRRSGGPGGRRRNGRARVDGPVEHVRHGQVLPRHPRYGHQAIIGCDVWLTNEAERDKPHRLLLLARNRAGYLRLCELLSRAWRDNQHRGRAEVHKSWFADGGGDGLIALSGGMQGDIATALLQDNIDAARRLCADWAQYFPNSYYIELQRAGLPGTERYIDNAVHLAGELGLPVVATQPVQFLRKSDFRAHEARVCISEGYVLGDQ